MKHRKVLRRLQVKEKRREKKTEETTFVFLFNNFFFLSFVFSLFRPIYVHF